MDHRVRAGEISEDQVTSFLERNTAQLPSSTYLALSIGSMVASVAFKIAGKDNMALFVGQWAAPFLIIGTYNKLVKLHGSDATTKEEGFRAA